MTFPHRVSSSEQVAKAVPDILRAFAQGDVSIRELATRHGVAEQTVRAIVTGKTHCGVPGPRLSRERIAELAEKHVAEGRRKGAARGLKPTCSGCGGPWHPITKCASPRGVR